MIYTEISCLRQIPSEKAIGKQMAKWFTKLTPTIFETSINKMEKQIREINVKWIKLLLYKLLYIQLTIAENSVLNVLFFNRSVASGQHLS